MIAAVRRWTGRQWLGGFLLLIGIGATVALAFVAGASKPPSQSVQVGLTALSILANAGASFAFSGVGKADPTHAQQSAARLFALGRRVAVAKVEAETMFESNAGKADLHTMMGILNTHLSWIEESVVGSVEDWRAFHPYAVERAQGERNPDDDPGDEND